MFRRLKTFATLTKSTGSIPLCGSRPANPLAASRVRRTVIRTMPRTVEPIEVFNRYTGQIEREPIYGERWLRWTYETAAGRLTLALLVRRAWFSRFYGWRMSRPASARLIAPFLARYKLDASEFAQGPESFTSFNDFFVRRLKPSARPICATPGAVVFPADGRHLGFANIDATTRVYAKGQHLDMRALLGDEKLAQEFAGGSLVVSRLCPIDYHRFHYACDGTTTPGRLINGALHSVSPIALRRTLDYFLQNKRVVSVLESAALGRVVLLEIGATCVGGIIYTSNNGRVARGEERGFFKFGGSCVMTLFSRGRVQLDADLLEQSANGCELYARMGDHMGVAAGR